MSREIDRRVAKEVMGWEIHEAFPNEFETPLILDFDNEDSLLVSRAYDDGFDPDPWSPSTDMNAAMEVEKETCLYGWGNFTLKYDDDRSRWSASFENYDDIIRAFADTPAMAICLAALKAMEKDGNKLVGAD